MHSILFHIGPVPIRAYGLMLWIALVVGLLRTLRASKRTSIEPNQVVDISFYAILSGILFAHIGSILLDLPNYLRNPGDMVALWEGILAPSGGLRGLSFHGGLIGALGVILLYTRVKRISFLEVADLFAPGLAIGYAIARIGCFLNGCCYGIPTDLPWGVHFHLDPMTGETTPPSHPVQLYATAISMLIYFILIKIDRRKRFTGQVFWSYLAVYSVYRFLIEFLRRGVTGEFAFAGLTEAQLASMVMFVLAGALIRLGMKRTEQTQPQPMARKPAVRKH